LDNAKSFWKTDGVYIKWGGRGLTSYVSDIITDFKFDDNNNGDPTDDYDRLQDSYAYGLNWGGYLGSGLIYGLGNNNGSITKQGPVFTEMSLGKGKFRYYKHNKSWIETNGAVSYLYNFNTSLDYVKVGNQAEKNIVDNVGWESYYASTLQPGYLAYRNSSNNIIFGAVATNAPYYDCINKSTPGYNRIVDLQSSSTTNTKIYWYSDKSGGYQDISKFSDSILTALNFITSPTEIQSEGSTGAVVWETNYPINVTPSMSIATDINLQNKLSGKLYLQSTLTSGINQLVAQDVHPFYLVNGNYLIVVNTDKKIYKPNETVFIYGEAKNLADEATDAILTMKTKISGGTEQELLSDTLTIPAGGSHPFAFYTIAGTDGTVSLTGTLTQSGTTLVQIADQYEVASPKVTAALTAPDTVGEDPFVLTLTLTNVGKTEALVSVLSSITALPETITVSAGQTRLLQYSRQISADTTDTF